MYSTYVLVSCLSRSRLSFRVLFVFHLSNGAVRGTITGRDGGTLSQLRQFISRHVRSGKGAGQEYGGWELEVGGGSGGGRRHFCVSTCGSVHLAPEVCVGSHNVSPILSRT